ncbi:Cys-tRNA(Pro) deacylase [Paracoccus litorisediminis]|uniref:Cys-tRNA(Pro)/Cys-tRNA(Cys) deacylase n=1 Tax=Paracoccus litorisediminis TaxID=2006130 RepID=A0A844HLH5_9RHOB|nr:Cys-tRNA(Pro) deacylase [Paracoccus litorisediminis]MTH60770.1 Cys-tRNA(Pro) deacylase [Paracoccus litorisediminis]
MARGTPATLVLSKAGITFELVEYDYDPGGERVGLQAAEAMQVTPDRVFKTLMAEVDGKPICAILPSDAEVDMKALAAVCGGKSARMMKPDVAERMTGYKVGGISPLGQRKQVTALLEQSAQTHATIYVNGGRRGLQIVLAPDDLTRALSCDMAKFAR